MNFITEVDLAKGQGASSKMGQNHQSDKGNGAKIGTQLLKIKDEMKANGENNYKTSQGYFIINQMKAKGENVSDFQIINCYNL